MLIEIIPAILLLIYLVIASVQDIKTREVSDFFAYTLIPISFIISIIISIAEKSAAPIITTSITFIVFWLLAVVLYRAKQWGGGDAKMFMAVGASLSAYPQPLLHYFSPNLPFPFPIIIFVNLLIAGSFYGIIYFMILSAKHNISIKMNKWVTIGVTLLSILILSSSLVAPPQVLVPVFMLAFLVFIAPYITKLSKVIQKKCFIKTIPLNKLTEGDWIDKNIYKNNKLLLSKNIPGISLEEIEMLKRNNIKQVSVRYGIPFIPPFLISVLISLILGSLFIF